jgi:hypothetical protein
MGMPTMQNQRPQNQGKGVSPGNAGNPYMAQNSWQPIGSPPPPQPQVSPDQSSLAARAAAGLPGVPSYARGTLSTQQFADDGSLMRPQPQSDFNTIEGDDFGTQRPDPYANQSFSQRVNSGKGMGSNVTMPGQGGQPRVGQPNNYTKTTGGWDNARIWPQQSSQSSGGKGKGY